MVIEMHTVGTSTWINIEVDYPKYLTHVFKHPTYFNGALHWICRDADRNASIWAFDFDTEQFQFFSNTPKGQSKGTILKFRDSLCFIDFNDQLISMWMMKRYGVGESWIPIFQYSVITAQLPGCMAYLDRENQEFMIFGTPWHDFKVHGKFQVLGHVPTLIPLKNIIIGDNVEVQNIYSLDNPN
ncbi:F-box protein interaction domain protein [Arachis hypogaea]|nr:F-box protein interaction domain protein [Arachis hypogaea]